MKSHLISLCSFKEFNIFDMHLFWLNRVSFNWGLPYFHFKLSSTTELELFTHLRCKKVIFIRYSVLGFTSPDYQQSINSTQRESELKEASNVQVLLIDSDSETESDSEPTVVKIAPKLESCNVLNRHPKFLLNYSIPVSDSESENERSNEVDGTSVKPSSRVSTDQAGGDGHNSQVVTLEDCEARQELTEESSFRIPEIEEISPNYKKTKDTSKKSSNSSLEKNQSKNKKEIFVKSLHKNGKKKLDESSQLIGINILSNSHDAIGGVGRRKNIFDECTSCNVKESAFEITPGQTQKISQPTEGSTNICSSKNEKNSSNQIRNTLIKNLLTLTEKSFTEQNTFSDQETKKSKKRKRKSEKVSLVGINESNTAAPLKTSKSGSRPANLMVPCLPAVGVALQDENNFQVKLSTCLVKHLTH